MLPSPKLNVVLVCVALIFYISFLLKGFVVRNVSVISNCVRGFHVQWQFIMQGYFFAGEWIVTGKRKIEEKQPKIKNKTCNFFLIFPED